MLALNCSRVRCFASGVYNACTVRFRMSSAEQRFSNLINVSHMRTFGSSSLKRYAFPVKYGDERRYRRTQSIRQREMETSIVDNKPQDQADSFSDLPEYDRFGSLAGDQTVVHAHKTVLSDKRGPKYVRKRSRTDNEWSQTFGTLSNDVDEFLDKYTKKSFADDQGEEDESEKPYVRLSEKDRKHKPFYYGERISRLGKAGKVYEAMEVLEKQMLKEDRVMPSQFVFTVLIGVLGRAGYTKKAFQLFNKMKKFGLTPEDPTYTALFNACSNSPWPLDGIQRADDLRALMSEKNYSPNMMTYNAMIKAYARCGDVQKAFAVVDEAIAAGHKPRGPCYCFILMACAADHEAGTKLAIEVWRLMRQNRVKPSIHHYNLLLRAVRDCGLGDSEFAQQLLVPDKLQLGQTSSPVKATQTEFTIDSAEDNKSAGPRKSNTEDKMMPSAVFLQSSSSSLETTSPLVKGCSIFDANVPDLLEPTNTKTGVIKLNVPRSADGRLALLGGLPGVLAQMQRHEAVPDIKTFSLLLELVPSSRDAENDLMSAMTLHGVRPDVDFFSMLIRKRNLRRDHNGARRLHIKLYWWRILLEMLLSRNECCKDNSRSLLLKPRPGDEFKEALKLVREAGLTPTIRTFGCMAMGCPTLAEARQLVKDIQAAGMAPNVEICQILLFQSHLDFNYKLEVLHVMKSFDVRPSEKLIEKLEKSIQFARRKIVLKEKGERISAFYSSDYFADGFYRFMVQYRNWLVSMQLEPKVHPWAQYRQPTPSLEKMNAPDEFPRNDIRSTPSNKLEAV